MCSVIYLLETGVCNQYAEFFSKNFISLVAHFLEVRVLAVKNRKR